MALQFEELTNAVASEHPSLAEEAKKAQAEMAGSAVGKGFAGVTVELKRRMGREFVAYEKNARAQVQKFSSEEEVDLEMAKVGLANAAAMTKGRVPVDILRNVIAYNPDYRNDPLKEMRDGWRAGFSTKMDEKKREVNFLVMYPGSWKPMPAVSRAELFSLWNDAGHGRHRVSFQAIDAPDPKYAKMDTVELAKMLMTPEAKLIESGKGKLAGLECGRIVYDLSTEKDGETLVFRAINYSVHAKDHFVILNLLLSDEDGLSKEELVKKYDPMLAEMATKLEIE